MESNNNPKKINNFKEFVKEFGDIDGKENMEEIPCIILAGPPVCGKGTQANIISKGMRYPDGRKVSTLLNRGYTPSLKRTCAVTTIPSVSGLSEASFIYEPVTSSTNYFSNKLNRTKTSRFSGDSVEPANPLSSYKLTNVSGSDILITSYDSSTSLTGGITLGYANPDKTSGSLYLSTLDKAPFKFDGCEIFFASDSTIDTAASTYKVTSIFDIS